MSSNSSNQPIPSVQDAVAKTARPKGDTKKPNRWYRFGMVVGIIAWTFLGFMLAQAVGLAAVAGLQWAGLPFDTVNATVFNTVANIFIYVLAVVVIVGVPRWLKKRGTSLLEMGVSKGPKWLDIVWLITGVVTYLFLTVLITSLAMVLFPSANYAEKQEIGFSGLSQSWEYSLAFLSLVIVAPVAEELIFRGYLFGKLRKYAAVWVSVILSAALFAVAHLQFNVALDTFALGIVLALLRVTTGSIWASIALHALKNGVAYYFLFVNPLVL
jgi:membrane protease YdiL (CAAX protease family)